MSDHDLELRFLVVAPIGRDAVLTHALLARAGISAEICVNLANLCKEIERGAGGVAIAQEALRPKGLKQLTDLLATQAPWSDLPIILFAREAAELDIRPETAEMLRALGNVALLDRPLRPIAMISAARAALRARHRQYEARDELARRETAVRERDHFLAMLGHELRNPLGSIVLAADTLEGVTIEQARRLEIIRRQGRHLSRLVDDLLDVARVTSGKVTLRYERVDLNELCERAIRPAETSARMSDVELRLERSVEPLVVSGDPVRLEQIIGNLVTNGVKYTTAGGHVIVSLAAERGEAVCRVRDDGVGIAGDTLPHVFELFAQADRTLDRSQGGLGIGLTVVRALVELHGGKIEANSAGLGYGSEFVLTLPMLAGAQPTVVPASVPVVTNANVHRVLLVEDNEDARELMKMVLGAYGHDVQTAADGLEGVRMAIEMKPDVALVDLGLPGLDGFGVARRVREELGGDVILIALSGYGQAEDRRQAFDAGFDLHYLKPVDSGRLRKLLSRGRDELRQQQHDGLLARE